MRRPTGAMVGSPAMSFHYVQKQAVPVRVKIGSHELAGEVHVAIFSATRNGPEQVSDILLNDEEAFFPLTTDRGVQFIAKNSVDVIHVGEPPKAEDYGTPTQFRIGIVTQSGNRLSGTLLESAASPGDRPLEMLNQAAAFFPVADSAGQLLFVRTRAVLRAWPLSASEPSSFDPLAQNLAGGATVQKSKRRSTEPTPQKRKRKRSTRR